MIAVRVYCNRSLPTSFLWILTVCLPYNMRSSATEHIGNDCFDRQAVFKFVVFIECQR